VFDGKDFVRAGVAVDPESGKIMAVGRDLQGDEVHDHADALVLPGAVDIHVHLRDPGAPQKEDFASGTKAALAGGVTTVFDMPNTDPATTTAVRYDEKREIAGSKAATDWGLWGGTRGGLEDTLGLVAKAPGLKVYLGPSTGDVTMGDGQRLQELLLRLKQARWSGVVAFHAEDQKILEDAGREHADASGLAGHEARRPAVAEAQAFATIQRALEAAGGLTEVPFRIHLAHVSTRGLLDAGQAAGVSMGVTPHHLLLHHGVGLGAFGRVNPPLRSQSEQEAVLEAYDARRLPVLESDHAPHTKEEKQVDVKMAPSGMPGVETMVPLLLARALQAGGGSAAVARVVDSVTRAPAELFGLQKGRLEVGFDADIAVYDPGAVVPLRAQERVTRCGWSPFEGWPVVFPRAVYRRAEMVVEGGRVIAREGSGKEVVVRLEATQG
jgi:dihydroorotase